jgi:hypothetical protein
MLAVSFKEKERNRRDRYFLMALSTAEYPWPFSWPKDPSVEKGKFQKTPSERLRPA